jgi:hypothetical protein
MRLLSLGAPQRIGLCTTTIANVDELLHWPLRNVCDDIMEVTRVSWISCMASASWRSGTGYSAVFTLKEDKLKVAGF